MSTPARTKLLARLHCIKKEQGWSDDEYRDILEAKSGARSGADLDDAALARLVATLGGQRTPERSADPWTWVNAAPLEKRGILWKLRRICINLGIPPAQQIAYTEGVAARVYGHERHLKMMTAGELWNLIGPLERTARYKAAAAAAPAKK